MGKAASETYTNAGILKKAGNGLMMDLAGAEFFLMHEDLSALQNNQAADIVNYLGEAEGVAWLSPVAARTKTDMTGIIASHIYVIPYQRFCRVLGGHQRRALVREYHPAHTPVT
jgi:hypothetical protein